MWTSALVSWWLPFDFREVVGVLVILVVATASELFVVVTFCAALSGMKTCLIVRA